MYHKQGNKTAIQSQHMIADALFSLMKHKPFHQITVTEICEEANLGRKTFYRNFELRDKNGKTIGYARSVWAMISMESRKPADLISLHGNNLGQYVSDRECPINKPGRIKVSVDAPVEEYQTRYSDIDINGHVNSIKYIEHILDLFPMDTFKEKQVKRFEMAYLAESYYGDVLSFYLEEKNENEYDIEVKKNNQEVVVRSKVIFK